MGIAEWVQKAAEIEVAKKTRQDEYQAELLRAKNVLAAAKKPFDTFTSNLEVFKAATVLVCSKHNSPPLMTSIGLLNECSIWSLGFQIYSSTAADGMGSSMPATNERMADRIVRQFVDQFDRQPTPEEAEALSQSLIDNLSKDIEKIVAE